PQAVGTQQEGVAVGQVLAADVGAHDQLRPQGASQGVAGGVVGRLLGGDQAHPQHLHQLGVVGGQDLQAVAAKAVGAAVADVAQVGLAGAQDQSAHGGLHLGRSVAVEGGVEDPPVGGLVGGPDQPGRPPAGDVGGPTG